MKAFPHTYDQIIDGHVATCTNYGMDLRDWFAAHAMQGMCSYDNSLNYREIAEEAYLVADLMMKAREQ